jgi:hypothetical protein
MWGAVNFNYRRSCNMEIQNYHLYSGGCFVTEQCLEMLFNE